jgi:hypothetical protein
MRDKLKVVADLLEGMETNWTDRRDRPVSSWTWRRGHNPTEEARKEAQGGIVPGAG